MTEFMLDHMPATLRDFLAPVRINKCSRTIWARDRQAIPRPTVGPSQARNILDVLRKRTVGQGQKNQTSIYGLHYVTPRRYIPEAASAGRPEEELCTSIFPSSPEDYRRQPHLHLALSRSCHFYVFRAAAPSKRSKRLKKCKEALCGRFSLRPIARPQQTSRPRCPSMSNSHARFVRTIRDTVRRAAPRCAVDFVRLAGMLSCRRQDDRMDPCRFTLLPASRGRRARLAVRPRQIAVADCEALPVTRLLHQTKPSVR
jgi:hypothetical protein